MEEISAKVEREVPLVLFDEIWSKRGTNTNQAQLVPLTGGWKSGYGLPLFVALKESNINADKSEENTIMGYCLAIFEDRTLGKSDQCLIPIGYIFIHEVSDPQNQEVANRMICDNNFEMGITTRVIEEDGQIGPDPLFSNLYDYVLSTIPQRKVPLAAIRVGFDTTYGEQRKSVISRLRQRTILDKVILNDIDANSISRARKLSEYQHTHLGLGDLLLQGAADVCRRRSFNNLYVVGPNQNSRKLISRSGYQFSEVVIRGVSTLNVDVTSKI